MPKLIIENTPQAVGTPQADSAAFGGQIGQQSQRLGQVASQTAMLAERSANQVAKQAASQAEAELKQATSIILADNDIGTRKQRFEQAAKDIAGKHRPTGLFSSQSTFDREINFAQGIIGSGVDRKTRVDQVNLGRESETFRLSQFTEDYSEGGDEVERDLVKLRAIASMQEAVESGFFSEEEAAEVMTRFEVDAERKAKAVDDSRFVEGQVGSIMGATAEDGGLLNLKERLILAREVDDQDLRDEVVRRVKNQTNEEKAVERERQRALSDESWGAVFQGAGESSIHPDLPVKEKEQLRQAIAKRLEARAEDKPFTVHTDESLFKELVDLAESDPKAFLARNIHLEAENLEIKHINLFRQMQSSIREGQTSSGSGSGAQSFPGGDVARINKDIAAREVSLDAAQTGRVQIAYIDYLAENPEATLDDKRAQSARLISEEVFTGSTFLGLEIPFTGGSKLLGDLAPDEVGELILDPPDSLLDMVEQDFLKIGIPLSDDPEGLRADIQDWFISNGVRPDAVQVFAPPGELQQKVEAAGTRVTDLVDAQ